MTSETTVVWVPGEPPEPTANGSTWVYAGNRSATLIGKTLYRSLVPFDNDLEYANECLDLWRSFGRKGSPATPAALASLAVIPARACPSANNYLAPLMHGALSTIYKPGATLKTARHYDLRCAYLWAARYGFPQKQFPASARMKHWAGAWLCEKLPAVPLPDWVKQGEPFLWTDEDQHVYQLPGKLLYGVSWPDNDASVYEGIAEFQQKVSPRIWKAVRKGFWGKWFPSDRCVRHIYAGGKVSKKIPVPGFSRNLVWAALTLHRVGVRMCQEVTPDTLAVFVDSILTCGQIKEGDDYGDFRLESTYKGGVMVETVTSWRSIHTGRGK